jgi:hypothetical protein
VSVKGGEIHEEGLASAVFALVAGVVASQALAAKPFAQATGGVTLSTPTQYLQFNAFDYGDTGGRGVVNYTNEGVVSYQADVVCASVDLTTGTALFAYQIPAGTGLGLDGLYIVWQVTDKGSPGAGNDTAGFYATSSRDDAMNVCNGLTTTFTMYDIVAGNLVVH